jgi:hypothetical protein
MVEKCVVYGQPKYFFECSIQFRDEYESSAQAIQHLAIIVKAFEAVGVTGVICQCGPEGMDCNAIYHWWDHTFHFAKQLHQLRMRSKALYGSVKSRLMKIDVGVEDGSRLQWSVVKDGKSKKTSKRSSLLAGSLLTGPIYRVLPPSPYFALYCVFSQVLCFSHRPSIPAAHRHQRPCPDQ